ncbi:hypothetical protein [Shewanella surugensis]|uniref:Uncharacterized protein n=1 Tax=Shewanella surugensis TaxID=212020 RepID=A0ABT0LHJ3_9GAMM|nr:hypothetical protein [Shewanella surugensis]MCL1127168.1 hypothetical protein [Shewanella surugensis]
MKITLLIFNFYLLIMFPLNVFANLCKIPTTLTGKRIVLELNGQYTTNNPRAGELQEFTFISSTTLKERSFHTGQGLSGPYQYQVLAPDIGLLTTTLMQKEILISKFDLIFMCQNNTTGRYIFSQGEGIEKPTIRQNVGTYFIRSH